MNRDSLREAYPRRADDVEFAPYTGTLIELLEETVDRLVTTPEPQDEMERRTR